MSVNDDIDLEATARGLIERFGADAARQARIRATELLDNGEAEGHALWLKICGAVGEILERSPTSGWP